MLRTLLSVILGLIVGVVLARSLKSRIEKHGPNSNKVRKEIFKKGDGCYQLKPVVHICPISYSKKKH